MQELLWLLLPIAAFSGWRIGVRQAGRRGWGRRRDLRPDYFRGLNFVLNEQPDKAIEVFIRMVEVDEDTVETHLALGSLFRRRGEVDRAIRIHQNLIARPRLEEEHRVQAVLELGQDYMKAGLLDRAEALFQELLEQDQQPETALSLLLDIYQCEKEWHKAIDIARRLERRNGGSRRLEVAQFHCELAEEAMARGDRASAADHVEAALAEDRQCVRASLLSARLAMDGGDWDRAARVLRRIEDQDIDYLPEVLPLLRACHERMGDMDGLVAYLRQVLQRYPGISPVLMLARLLRRQESPRAAAEFIAGELARRPSVRGLRQLMELSREAAGGECGMLYDEITAILDKLLEGKPVYKCVHCGFSGRTLHWQCPSCKKWSTVKPIHSLEAE